MSAEGVAEGHSFCLLTFPFWNSRSNYLNPPIWHGSLYLNILTAQTLFCSFFAAADCSHGFTSSSGAEFILGATHQYLFFLYIPVRASHF